MARVPSAEFAVKNWAIFMTLFMPLTSQPVTMAAVRTAIDDALSKDQETLVLASLPANTWTDFPESTLNPNRAIAGFSVSDSAGTDITSSVEVRQNGGTWQISSIVPLTNVQIKLEY